MLHFQHERELSASGPKRTCARSRPMSTFAAAADIGGRPGGPPAICRPGPVEGATLRGDRATATLEDICHRAFPPLVRTVRYIKALRRWVLPCPLQPRERTFSARLVMSALGQKATSFDYF